MKNEKQIEKLENKLEKISDKISTLNDKLEETYEQRSEVVTKIAELKCKVTNVAKVNYGVKNSKLIDKYSMVDVINHTESHSPIFKLAGVYINSYNVYEMENGILFNVFGGAGDFHFNCSPVYWNKDHFKHYDKYSKKWEGEPYCVDDFYDEDELDMIEEETDEINSFIEGMTRVAQERIADKTIEKELSKK